jgi:hypothetical protein
MPGGPRPLYPESYLACIKSHVNDVKIDGSLEFVHDYGGNESKPSYQEASGVPVENISPLGLQVNWFTTIFLNIGQMIGTGFFSTRTFPNHRFILAY